MKTTALLIALGVPLLAAQPLQNESQLVARMTDSEAQRQAALAGYSNTRRYTLDNKSRHASMTVRATVLPDGTKQFAIVEESGSAAVRKHVFHKILEEEAEASNPKLRGQSRFSPENYSFHIAGTESVNGRTAYVVDVAPRRESKYLISGKIWVDAEEYAVLKVEGKPAKNPSFWTKSVRFVHLYEKTDAFWFPVSNRSVTDARLFGRTDMIIEYFDYLPNAVVASAAVR